MNDGSPSALVEVRGLKKYFDAHGAIKAVDDISFDVRRGEVLGLVGESGSGKTTTGRALLRLTEPTAGTIRYDGVDITHLRRARMRDFRRKMQIVFQDPYSSLNPKHKVVDAIGEALRAHNIGTRADRRERVARLLEDVGMPADAMERYPHEFSGGQRQRIGIARALAVSPSFIVADEPVSALDVSVQAQVVNLLQDLQRSLGLTILFITHDLAVVQYISDRIAVLYLGRLMEIGPSNELCEAPKHPYTEALLAAAPVPDPTDRDRKVLLKGDIPSPRDPPSGCVFRTRCRFAIGDCARVVPPLRQAGPDRFIACIRDDIL